MGIPDILRVILDAKRAEVERLKAETPLSELQRRIEGRAPPANMAGALMGESVRVISEIKKASPSKGLLRADFDPVALATAYADNGAAAISVLTEVQHFQGSLEHLSSVQAIAGPRGLPVLRKDFIFDPYQVVESRAYGADAVLLIVAALSPDMLQGLMGKAAEHWMQCLVEVHDESELEVALDAGAEIVGINNRDLRTFETDLAVTERLAPLAPHDKIVVSESGIAGREDILRVAAAGANAVLVGESLVTADDPGARLRELV
jgi:indole-3-glycerol phosphate synthase